MGMTRLDLLPVDAPYRAYTQQVQAGYGAVDGCLIVAAQGMQQCLQAAHPRLVQRRTCALAAFGDPGVGCDHSRQLHVALRRHAGDGKAMCGAAFQRGTVLQKLLGGVQVACALLESATVACARCCFAQKLQERFAVICCKPAWAGALQLAGELEQCIVQVVWPGLSHGQGNTCMQLGTFAYGRERVRGFHHPLMGKAQAVLALLQETRANQGFQRFARRLGKDLLKQALIAAAARRAGHPQQVALRHRQAGQAVDHQVGDIVGIAVAGHGLQAP